MTVEFVDTNVLVYAFDRTAGAKRAKAVELLQRLWLEGTGALSTQVLQELYVTLTRKIPSPLKPVIARKRVEALGTWKLVAPQLETVLRAIDAAERWRISFWDALIIEAARDSAAEIVWSEHLSHGQDYGGVVIRDPFFTA